MERTFDFAGERRVGLVGLFPRRLRSQLHDGIEFWIDFGDPVQMRLNDFLGAPFLRSNGLGKFSGRCRYYAVIGFRCRSGRIDQQRPPHRRSRTYKRSSAKKIPTPNLVAHRDSLRSRQS